MKSANILVTALELDITAKRAKLHLAPLLDPLVRVEDTEQPRCPSWLIPPCLLPHDRHGLRVAFTESILFHMVPLDAISLLVAM